MATYHSVKADIMTLNDFNKQSLFNFLAEILSASPLSMMECRESRFSKGQVCPHCEGTHVIKYGMIKSQQRYQCKTCHRTFTDFTKSALSHSHLPLTTWLEYTKCMILGLSIRKSAERVNVSVKTSFYMRHKILDAIRLFLGVGNLEGIIEMDETFFPLSFKGNHKKSGFNMPRESRKRGGEVEKRGISSEQVCVATAIDRNGNLVMELLCLGRMKTVDIKRLYENRIEYGAIICTDSHKSYISFAKDFGLQHKRIPTGKHMAGIYHIQHINSLHSHLKGFLESFKGVSTKYLGNYLYWFKWLEYFKEEKEILKGKNLLLHGVSSVFDIKINDYKTRRPLFFRT
jgi:transposase-like protein